MRCVSPSRSAQRSSASSKVTTLRPSALVKLLRAIERGRRDASGLPDVANATRQAWMGRGPFRLLLDPARHARNRVQLGQAPNQGVGVAGELHGAKVACGFLPLFAPCAHRQ